MRDRQRKAAAGALLGSTHGHLPSIILFLLQPFSLPISQIYFLMKQISSVNRAKLLQIPQQLCVSSFPLSYQHKPSSDLACRARKVGLKMPHSADPSLLNFMEHCCSFVDEALYRSIIGCCFPIASNCRQSQLWAYSLLLAPALQCILEYIHGVNLGLEVAWAMQGKQGQDH